jgi:hypothetical protein
MVGLGRFSVTWRTCPRPRASTTARGLLPGFPGGLDSTVLLLVVAIVGTTVA